MKFLRPAAPLLLSLWAGMASAENMLSSSSLSVCQADSGFTAQSFDLTYKPSDGFITVNIDALMSIRSYVVFTFEIYAYGWPITTQTINPCDTDVGLCPMLPGRFENNFTLPVPASAVDMIPPIAFTFPDIDAQVHVNINETDKAQSYIGDSVACLDARINNGKTVDLTAVKWVTALIAGLALVSSALINGVAGHANAASHVAANALSLVSYFQAQAIVGLTGITLPPGAMSWLQNFQWSLGIVNVGFIQTICLWYQRATGGEAAGLFHNLDVASVEIMKRGVDVAEAPSDLFSRAVALDGGSLQARSSGLAKRGNYKTEYGAYEVWGIQRVAFLEGIETTNLFLTCMISFIVTLALTALSVTIFKYGCDFAVKRRWVRSDKFEFRHNFRSVLKGILYRIILIGYAPMMLISFWEFTQVDSAAVVLLAVFFILVINAILGWGAWKVISIARRSIALYKNPAYVLFSSNDILDKWGFLYIQWRASAYYFIVPWLGYLLLKSLFVAFAQNTGIAQAIGLMLIEAGALITASVMRPWMDKKTNSFNIAIYVINFINAVFLLIFSNVFDQPRLVTGIVGILLWIVNTIFTFVYLVMLIVTTVLVMMNENPDGRYKFMADDRTSFMKSATQINTTTELDALGAAARGGNGNLGYKPRLDLDEDDAANDNMSITSDAVRRGANTQEPPMVSAAGSMASQEQRSIQHSLSTHSGGYRGVAQNEASPVSPAVPMFPAEQAPPYQQQPQNYPQGQAAPGGWQRGAGYDH